MSSSATGLIHEPNLISIRHSEFAAGRGGVACRKKHHQKAIDRHKGAEQKERKKVVRERAGERESEIERSKCN